MTAGGRRGLPRLPGLWLLSEGPEQDVVVSSRMRLARNLSDHAFKSRLREGEAERLESHLREVLGELGDGLQYVSMNALQPTEREVLFERHLISAEHVHDKNPRGVAFTNDGMTSVMVNEEDHLRLQVLLPGFRLVEAFDRVRLLEEHLEDSVDLAFDSRWGYLTACPTNVGCGIRLSVMLHLPGLRITNEIERVRRAAKELHLAVRGYYGEGSETSGDFYQVSNQVTLGVSEQHLLSEFSDRIVPEVIAYEREARRMLAERSPILLDDRVFRAWGVLTSARSLGLEESMKLLSRLRMGICLGRIGEVPIGTVNRLFLMVQPAHLRTVAGLELDDDALRESRANLVRNTLQAT